MKNKFLTVWFGIVGLAFSGFAQSWSLLAWEKANQFASTSEIDAQNNLIAEGGTIQLGPGDFLAIVRSIDQNRILLVAQGPAEFTLESDSQKPFVLSSGLFALHCQGSAGDVRLAIPATGDSQEFGAPVPVGALYIDLSHKLLRARFEQGQSGERWPETENAIGDGIWVRRVGGRFEPDPGYGPDAFFSTFSSASIIREVGVRSARRERTILQLSLVRATLSLAPEAKVEAAIQRTQIQEIRQIAPAISVVTTPTVVTPSAGLTATPAEFGFVRFPGDVSPAEIVAGRTRFDRAFDANFGGRGLGTNGFSFLGVPPIGRNGQLLIGPGIIISPVLGGGR